MSLRLILRFAAASMLVGCTAQEPQQSQARVVGGTDVTDGTDAIINSTVSILNENGLCTGTLIGPNQITSAAHCIDNGEMRIGAGPHGDVLPNLHVILKRAHPRWNQGPNDVSIIIFEGTLPDGLSPVRIGPTDGITDGASVILAGYGVTAENANDPGVLRKVTAQVNHFDQFTKEFYMQTGLGVGSCYGDSGGPAFIPLPGSMTVIGSTSRGNNCDTGDGIYEDIRYFQGWYKCTAKEAGKPLRYLANDDSNVDCQAGTVDTDVDPGTSDGVATPINVALSALPTNGNASYSVYFSIDRATTNNSGSVEYCIGTDSACAAPASVWLPSDPVRDVGAKSILQSRQPVALQNGEIISMRWTKPDGSQILAAASITSI